MGRVLRTKVPLKLGDVILEEKPLFAFGGQAGVTGLEKTWCKNCHRIVKEVDVVYDPICRSFLPFLSQPDEVRAQILSHFYCQDFGDDLSETRNKFTKMVYDVFAELCRLLTLPEYATDCIIGNYRLGELTAADIYKLYCILRLNAYAMNDDCGGLFYRATLMAHGCHYNTVFEFDKTRGVLVLTAVCSVPASGLLLTSYISFDKILAPTYIRRQYLYRVKSFWCCCDRCKADDITRPVKCPHPNCPGYLLYSIMRVYNWQCTHCRALYDAFAGPPIIQRELELLRNAMMLMLDTTPRLTMPEAEAKVALIKRELGEQHWLYFFYNVQLLQVQTTWRTDAIQVPATWAARTYPDACCRWAAAETLHPYLTTLLNELATSDYKPNGPNGPNVNQSIHDLFRNYAAAIPMVLSLFPPAADCEVCAVRDIGRIRSGIAAYRLRFCSCCFLQPVVQDLSFCYLVLTVLGRLAPQVLFQCAACKEVAYCSKECQKRHWKSEHKRTCRGSSPL